MKFVHYGTNNIDLSLILPITNRDTRHGTDKPAGGFWACPSDIRYGWAELLEERDMLDRLEKRVEFTIVSTAKVYTIATEDDLQALPQTATGRIDWEYIARIYDAVYFTEDMTTSNMDSPLYGWDVESIVILNKHSIFLGKC
jgi:hypothetical protein